MTSGSLARGLALLDRLAGEPGGLPLSRLSGDLDLPKSGAHRLLAALVEEGYVHQVPATGNYALTLRLVSLGLRHLAGSTITELATPLLTRLAGESGQLVRLGLVDGEQVLWVAKAQGARTGLRYDPDQGSEIPLAASASGLAWLAHLPEETALRLVAAQQPDPRHPPGHNAPRGLLDVAERLRATRERGWSLVHDSVEEGISAMAAPVLGRGGPLGVVSIAGPTVQLDDGLMEGLAPRLLALAAELSALAGTFERRGTGAPA